MSTNSYWYIESPPGQGHRERYSALPFPFLVIETGGFGLMNDVVVAALEKELDSYRRHLSPEP